MAKLTMIVNIDDGMLDNAGFDLLTESILDVEVKSLLNRAWDATRKQLFERARSVFKKPSQCAVDWAVEVEIDCSPEPIPDPIKCRRCGKELEEATIGGFREPMYLPCGCQKSNSIDATFGVELSPDDVDYERYFHGDSTRIEIAHRE